MAKKVSNKRQIGNYIRGAFNKAAIGETEQAIELWTKAIGLGYDPHPKTEKGLAIAIEKGERDRGVRPVQNGTESRGNGTE